MPDKLSELGKNLGQTKRNAETAIRRYQPNHPKIERVRDIFDDEVPFEMLFETRREEGTFIMSLDFNKPPPMNNCREGNFIVNCDQFTATTGDNLLNVERTYFPNTVTVYVDGVLLDRAYYSEYSPAEGLVYVIDRTAGEIISVCYLAISWERICDPTLDPLEGSTNASTYLAESFYSGSPVTVQADTDPATQFSNFAQASTLQAELQTQCFERSGYIAWSTHLGSLDNLPEGHANIAANGNMGWPERDAVNIDWTEVEVSFTALVRSGEHFGQYLGFFPNASEETLATFTVGSVDIEVTVRHDYRGGFFPFLGTPQGPEAFFRVVNSGNAYDENGNFIDSGSTVSGYYSIGSYNATFGVNINISWAERKILVRVAGHAISFTGDSARFDFATGGAGLGVSGQFSSYLTDPSLMSVEVTNIQVNPCAYEPGT